MLFVQYVVMKYGFSLVPTIYRVYLVVISLKQLVIEIGIFKITVRCSQADGLALIYPDPANITSFKNNFGINVAHLSQMFYFDINPKQHLS